MTVLVRLSTVNKRALPILIHDLALACLSTALVEQALYALARRNEPIETKHATRNVQVQKRVEQERRPSFTLERPSPGGQMLYNVQVLALFPRRPFAVVLLLLPPSLHPRAGGGG